MNREDIIRMAKECGLLDKDLEPSEWYVNQFIAFSILIASTERERIAKKIEQLPFGDTAASFAIYVRES